jgi:hypothetical protein
VCESKHYTGVIFRNGGASATMNQVQQIKRHGQVTVFNGSAVTIKDRHYGDVNWFSVVVPVIRETQYLLVAVSMARPRKNLIHRSPAAT